MPTYPAAAQRRAAAAGPAGAAAVPPKMQKLQIKEALDKRQIKYRKNAKKAELLALLAANEDAPEPKNKPGSSKAKDGQAANSTGGGGGNRTNGKKRARAAVPAATVSTKNARAKKKKEGNDRKKRGAEHGRGSGDRGARGGCDQSRKRDNPRGQGRGGRREGESSTRSSSRSRRQVNYAAITDEFYDSGD